MNPVEVTSSTKPGNISCRAFCFQPNAKLVLALERKQKVALPGQGQTWYLQQRVYSGSGILYQGVGVCSSADRLRGSRGSWMRNLFQHWSENKKWPCQVRARLGICSSGFIQDLESCTTELESAYWQTGTEAT